MALQEAEVLELGVVPLGFDEPPLLDVHHLPEAICIESMWVNVSLPPAPSRVMEIYFGYFSEVLKGFLHH